MLIVRAVDELEGEASLQGLRNGAGYISILVDRRYRWHSRVEKWQKIAELAAKLDPDTTNG